MFQKVAKMSRLPIFVILALVLCTDGQILHSASEEIRVDGNDFVSYNITSLKFWRPVLKTHKLRFDFKTVDPNGLLVYVGSEEERNDFILVDLVHGKLRYEVYFMKHYCLHVFIFCTLFVTIF